MKQRFRVLSSIAALAVMVCVTGSAVAQEDTMPAHPMFEHLKPVLRNEVGKPATPLTTWNGSFVYKNKTYKYNMVGTAPSTGKSTTIPVFVIPVVLTFKSSKGTTTFSPLTKLSNGQTAVQNTTSSPIFNNMDFTSGGIDLGTTQYVDAFQRGNFWSTVSKHTGYHALLGTPKTLPTLTLSVPSADGKVATEFGITVGTADINWFDGQLQSYISAHSQIVPNSLPIFITYDSYLTEFGSCCIGGYHSAFGSSSAAQAYAHFTYISTPGIFAQDVSALSHETAEWLDDPLVVNSGNPVACGVLEVGDPEEGFANYGAFPYTLNGFTYNLQDLVFLPYFGASSSTSVDKEMTFQNNPFNLTVCSNGG
ncbi:MAG TPA: hypothetical protein VMB66_13660 [Candidatus Acidoferrales bacterium]|nr:hypothetical protein [Candidatus Acidoferrales bacterium]